MSSEATLDVHTRAGGPTLYMAFELSERTWKVLFASGRGKRRERNVAARDMTALLQQIAEAKARFGLAADAGVLSVQEAGRDGFWLHRALELHGIESRIVDSASIEVPRHMRRRKTDRVDAIKLLGLLLRWVGGERDVLKVVRVPTPEAEDIRQLSRLIERLKAEHGSHVSRIKSLLATQGITLSKVGGADWAQRVGELRTYEGKPLGRWLQIDLVLNGQRQAMLEDQLAGLKAERNAMIRGAKEGAAFKARQLMRLGAIAWESSFVFATEVFGWRRFANRRELASSVGIVGTPCKSGGIDREQGLSKAGNKRMRAMLVEIAWCWLRHQGQSALARWYQRRFANGGKRARKIGIVALARKLLVALWRFLEQGIVPEGATLKREVAA